MLSLRGGFVGGIVFALLFFEYLLHLRCRCRYRPGVPPPVNSINVFDLNMLHAKLCHTVFEGVTSMC